MYNQNADRVRAETAQRVSKKAPQSQSALLQKRIVLWVVIGFVAIISITGVLGFGGVEGYSWPGAKIIFYICLIITVVLGSLAVLGGGLKRRSF